MTVPCTHDKVFREDSKSPWTCYECRVAFVPSDVLEEARKACEALQALEGVELEYPDNGAWAKMRTAAKSSYAFLRRIDEVLPSNKPPQGPP